MSSDDVWQTIHSDLEQLLKDSAATPLRPAVERVQQLASAVPRVIAAEDCQKWIAALRRIIAELQNGTPLGNLIKPAEGGTFVQPSWEVQTVYQSQGPIFHFVFQDVREQLKEPDTGISVPVVLLVMNDEEAQALDSGTAFQDYPAEARADFEELRAFLASHNMGDWLRYYQHNPEDWQPFKDSAETIGALTKRILGGVSGYDRQLVPQFHSIHTLIEDRPRLRELRTRGCVVIMDTISMHHPLIQRDFRRSLLDAYPNTLVARIAPISDMLTFVQRLILFAERSDDLEFYKRYAIDEDMKCTEVSREFDFRRWLKDKVPDLLSEADRAKEGIRKFMK